MSVYALTPTLFVGDEFPDLAGKILMVHEDTPADLEQAVDAINHRTSVVVPTVEMGIDILTRILGDRDEAEAVARLSNLAASDG